MNNSNTSSLTSTYIDILRLVKAKNNIFTITIYIYNSKIPITSIMKFVGDH